MGEMEIFHIQTVLGCARFIILTNPKQTELAAQMAADKLWKVPASTLNAEAINFYGLEDSKIWLTSVFWLCYNRHANFNNIYNLRNLNK